MPVWDPGGQNVTFLSDRGGNFDVWSRPADGTGEAELILDIDEDLRKIQWSPDGEWLLLSTDDGQVGSGGILAFRPEVDSVPTPLFVSEFREIDPVVSPDGRWIAYASGGIPTLPKPVRGSDRRSIPSLATFLRRTS